MGKWMTQGNETEGRADRHLAKSNKEQTRTLTKK